MASKDKSIKKILTDFNKAVSKIEKKFMQNGLRSFESSARKAARRKHLDELIALRFKMMQGTSLDVSLGVADIAMIKNTVNQALERMSQYEELETIPRVLETIKKAQEMFIKTQEKRLNKLMKKKVHKRALLQARLDDSAELIEEACEHLDTIAAAHESLLERDGLIITEEHVDPEVATDFATSDALLKMRLKAKGEFMMAVNATLASIDTIITKTDTLFSEGIKLIDFVKESKQKKYNPGEKSILTTTGLYYLSRNYTKTLETYRTRLLATQERFNLLDASMSSDSYDSIVSSVSNTETATEDFMEVLAASEPMLTPTHKQHLLEKRQSRNFANCTMELDRPVMSVTQRCLALSDSTSRSPFSTPRQAVSPPRSDFGTPRSVYVSPRDDGHYQAIPALGDNSHSLWSQHSAACDDKSKDAPLPTPIATC